MEQLAYMWGAIDVENARAEEREARAAVGARVKETADMLRRLTLENDALRANGPSVSGEIFGVIGMVTRQKDLERSMKARFEAQTVDLRAQVQAAVGEVEAAERRVAEVLREREQMEALLLSMEQELAEVERASAEEIGWLDEALARAMSDKAESQAARRNNALARTRRESTARSGVEKVHIEALGAARERMKLAAAAREVAWRAEDEGVARWGQDGAVFGDADAHLIISHLTVRPRDQTAAVTQGDMVVRDSKGAGEVATIPSLFDGGPLKPQEHERQADENPTRSDKPSRQQQDENNSGRLQQKDDQDEGLSPEEAPHQPPPPPDDSWSTEQATAPLAAVVPKPEPSFATDVPPPPPDEETSSCASTPTGAQTSSDDDEPPPPPGAILCWFSIDLRLILH